MSETIQVQLFLIRLKKIWNNTGRITLAQRRKNLESMSTLDFTMADVKDVCMALQPSDIRIGPVPHDHGFDGEVWVFTPMYKDKKMYLKIWLKTENNLDYMEIISFHEEGMP